MLNYSIHGPSDGQTVIFLHAVGIDSWMWGSFLPLLPSVRAVLIDLPGHGGSRNTPWVSLNRSAELIAEVVDHAGGQASHLAAISLGSYVGLHLLAKRPNQFRTAFLSGVHAGGMKNQSLMRLMSFFMAPLAGQPFFARKTARAFGVTSENIDAFVVAAGKTRPSAFRRGTNDVVAFELPSGLQDVRTDVEFVAGAREHPLILEALPVLANAVSNGSTMTIPNGGHGWPGAMPDRFAASLLELIRRRSD